MTSYQNMLFPEFRDKAVTLSYDDGHRNDIRLIETMTKYDLKGTFNLCTAILSGENRVHEEEVKSLYIDSGNEVAVHGERHLSLTAVGTDIIVKDVYECRKKLEDLTGEIITGMAYANGVYDDKAIEVLKACGIEYSRTIDNTYGFQITGDNWYKLAPTTHHANKDMDCLIDNFLDDKKFGYFWSNHPKLFYLWGHSSEFSTEKDWDIIENFGKRVGNNKDVWYATNIEIVKYVNAFKSLRSSLDGKLVYNPTSIDVYIQNCAREKFIIPKGKTVKIR